MNEQEQQLLKSKGYSDEDIAAFGAHESGTPTSTGTTGAPVASEEIPAVTQNMPTYHEEHATDWLTPMIPAVGSVGHEAWDIVKPTLELGLELGAGGLAAKKYGPEIFRKLGESYRGVPNVPPSAPPSGIVVPQNVGAGPRPGTGVPTVTPGTPGQTMEALRAPYSPSMAPPTPAPTVPATSVPQAQQQAGTFLENIAQKYGSVAQKVAPVLQKAAPMAQGISKAFLPAMMAKDLFYTTDAERAILQRAEAEKRAQGWHPANPLQGHWTSYYDRPQQ